MSYAVFLVYGGQVQYDANVCLAGVGIYSDAFLANQFGPSFDKIEEVGIDYEHVPVSFLEDSKTPEYLAINPNE